MYLYIWTSASGYPFQKRVPRGRSPYIYIYTNIYALRPPGTLSQKGTRRGWSYIIIEIPMYMDYGLKVPFSKKGTRRSCSYIIIQIPIYMDYSFRVPLLKKGTRKDWFYIIIQIPIYIN
jgi:hypothetical protein